MAPVSAFKMFFVVFFCILLQCQCYSCSKVAVNEVLNDCGLPDCMVLDGRTTSNIKVNANSDGSSRLFSFCYAGQHKELRRLWINPKISIVKSSEDQEIMLYFGKNLTEVKLAAKESSPWWKYMMSLTISVKENVALEAFNTSCIGISSFKPYSVQFNVKNPELWFIAYVLAGIILFFWAPVWSRNVLIHYSAGVSVGVLASILLLTYILHRMLPQKLKSVGQVTILFGGSLSLFALRWISTRIQDLLQNHWQLALGYVLVTGFISFAMVYRYGPITENKSLNLIQWLLQIIGLAFIYKGTQIAEASIAIIILVITMYVFPVTHFKRFKRFFRFKFFPPKPRLLTEEEYIEMKDRETEKALEELRAYCKSPECDTWRVVSHIKSPSRFASFIEGDDHLSEDEQYSHNMYSHYLPTDEDEDMSDIEFRLTSS